MYSAMSGFASSGRPSVRSVFASEHAYSRFLCASVATATKAEKKEQEQEAAAVATPERLAWTNELTASEVSESVVSGLEPLLQSLKDKARSLGGGFNAMVTFE